MLCTTCGQALESDAVFCRNCGRSVAPDDGPDARVQRLEARLAALEARVPRTNLLHANFWIRALAVWGHELACVGVIYAILLVFLLLFAGLAALASIR